MKNTMIFIGVIFLALNIYFWPKPSEESSEVFNYPNKFSVTLVGEVAYPATYDFYEPIYLNDIIKYAGGFTSLANINSINLGELITQNKIIVIDKNNQNNNSNEALLLNINTASFEELIKIPNITENRAANIIIYRKEYGLFRTLEDLLNVNSIGPATFEKIKEHLTV